MIVASENKVAMSETLEQSLIKLFGNGAVPAAQTTGETVAGAPPVPSQAPTTVNPGLAAQALQHYERAEQALKEGNWAKYGEELKKLRTTLEGLSQQK